MSVKLISDAIPKSEISEEQFELYEACILSGQVLAQDVPDLLAENPRFANWYMKRAKGGASRIR